jgi:hypothetical protein
VIDRDRRCLRYRAALLDFADHGEIGPETGGALAHLERCRACIETVEYALQTIAALRRLGDEVARAEPRPDAWARLRTRLDAWRPVRLAIMSPLAGMAVAAAIAVGLVAPLRFGPNPWGTALHAAGSANPAATAAAVAYWSSARRIIADANESTAQVRPPAAAQAKPSYPDGIRPVHEEVPSAHSTQRPTELR